MQFGGSCVLWLNIRRDDSGSWAWLDFQGRFRDSRSLSVTWCQFLQLTARKLGGEISGGMGVLPSYSYFLRQGCLQSLPLHPTCLPSRKWELCLPCSIWKVGLAQMKTFANFQLCYIISEFKLSWGMVMNGFFCNNILFELKEIKVLPWGERIKI